MTRTKTGNDEIAAPALLQKQKRVPLRASDRAGGRLRRCLRPAFLVILMLGTAAGIWKGTQAAEADPRFRLHDIELSGAQHVEQSEVEDVFAADRGRSLSRIPLAERRRALEDLPWVRSASITRVLPDRILVNVQERTPVAYVWTRRGVELLDSEGVILDAPQYTAYPLPVVRGISEQDSSEQRLAKMQRFMALTSALSPGGGPLAESISEVELGDPRDLQLIVTGPYGAIRLHLGDGSFRERYDVFAEQIDQWSRQFGQIDSIDLQFGGQAVVHAALPVKIAIGKNARATHASPAAPPGRLAPPPARASSTAPAA